MRLQLGIGHHSQAPVTAALTTVPSDVSPHCKQYAATPYPGWPLCAAVDPAISSCSVVGHAYMQPSKACTGILYSPYVAPFKGALTMARTRANRLTPKPGSLNRRPVDLVIPGLFSCPSDPLLYATCSLPYYTVLYYTLLGGSWDLVSRVISTLIGDISNYNYSYLTCDPSY